MQDTWYEISYYKMLFHYDLAAKEKFLMTSISIHPEKDLDHYESQFEQICPQILKYASESPGTLIYSYCNERYRNHH